MLARALAGGLLALLTVEAGALAGALYPIGQHSASIGFTVGGLGLFRAHGSFASFHGVLALDPAHPEATAITVTIDARSAMMGWDAAEAALRSSRYFDTARYPVMRFESRRATRIAPGLYRIAGTVTLRGVARPLRLRARVVRSDPAPGRVAGEAEVVATGQINRAEFGMTADRPMISNIVRLTIHAHIALEGGAPPAPFRPASSSAPPS